MFLRIRVPNGLITSRSTDLCRSLARQGHTLTDEAQHLVREEAHEQAKLELLNIERIRAKAHMDEQKERLSQMRVGRVQAMM